MDVVTNQYYGGIDNHHHYAYLCLLDQMGEVVVQGKFYHKDQRLIPQLVQYLPHLKVTMEAGYGWYPLADTLEANQIPFVLTHPAKMRVLSGKKKTDKEDALTLADLLRTHSKKLQLAYVPPKNIRDWRDLVRFRSVLVKRQTQDKVMVRDILAKQGLVCHYRDLMGKRGQVWLEAQTFPFPYNQEKTILLTSLRQRLETIQSLTNQIKLSKEQEQTVKLLSTIPGIGNLTATTIALEMGTITRFPNSRAFSSYLGLTPSVSSSGGKTYLGRTGRGGNGVLRFCLSESVPLLLQRDELLKARYDTLAQTKGKSKAKVAVMRHVSTIIYHMLKHDHSFQLTAKYQLAAKDTQAMDVAGILAVA